MISVKLGFFPDKFWLNLKGMGDKNEKERGKNFYLN
jgi:hypothetical protein